MVKKAIKQDTHLDDQIISDSFVVNDVKNETVMTFVNVPKEPYVVAEFAPIDPDPSSQKFCKK